MRDQTLAAGHRLHYSPCFAVNNLIGNLIQVILVVLSVFNRIVSAELGVSPDFIVTDSLRSVLIPVSLVVRNSAVVLLGSVS